MKKQPSGRRARERGFGLIDVMVAAAIMFSGAVVMITVLPKLIEISHTRVSKENAYIFATSLIENLTMQPYTTISPGPVSGNFATLLPDATDKSVYTWRYTSTEPKPGLLKRVVLGITWNGGSDTYVFEVADLRND